MTAMTPVLSRFGISELVPKNKRKDNFEVAVYEAANEIVVNLLEARPPELWFPAEWDFEVGGDGVGGPAPQDPVIIYLALPFGADDDYHVTYGLSLACIIDEMLEGVTTKGGGIAEDHKPSMRSLADALRKQVERIDAALLIEQE